jgi:HemY protein
MWRVFGYTVFLALLAFVAGFVAELSGDVAIRMGERQIGLSLSAALALLAIIILTCTLLLVLIKTLLDWPLRLAGRGKEKRCKRGWKALHEGLIAAGAGQGGKALACAREARRFLPQEPMVLLLDAQIAQASGDNEAVRTVFEAMAYQPATRLLSLRARHHEACSRGDKVHALALAEEACILAPDSAPDISWAFRTRLAECLQRQDWTSALALVKQAHKDDARLRAVLNTAEALSLAARDEDRALSLAKETARLYPDLVPAAVLAGQIFARRSEIRKATAVLEASWKALPHPDLADLCLVVRKGDSASENLSRASALAALQPGHPESALLLAKAHLGMRNLDEARQVLAPFLKMAPRVPLCLMMARIEEASGLHGGTREWLNRAAHAPRGPSWMADGIVLEHWSPISPLSGKPDSCRWQTPPDPFVDPSAAPLSAPAATSTTTPALPDPLQNTAKPV